MPNLARWSHEELQMSRWRFIYMAQVRMLLVPERPFDMECIQGCLNSRDETLKIFKDIAKGAF